MTPAQRLQAARDARHKLVTGTMARVFVDQNGERVEFSSTTINALDKYIRELEAQVSPVPACRGPIGFIF